MSAPHLDTDVLIRFLTGDDPAKQAEAAALLERVRDGELAVAAPDTVIADAVYVLSSPRLSKLSRPRVQQLLAPLVQLPHFKIQNRRVVLRALGLYATTNLDFGDAMIVASMQRQGSGLLYSYDTDFDRVRGIRRQRPAAAARSS